MITCYVRYVIDAKKAKQFEEYAKMWIPLVEKFGGQHNGYYLPSEVLTILHWHYLHSQASRRMRNTEKSRSTMKSASKPLSSRKRPTVY